MTVTGYRPANLSNPRFVSSAAIEWLREEFTERREYPLGSVERLAVHDTIRSLIFALRRARRRMS